MVQLASNNDLKISTLKLLLQTKISIIKDNNRDTVVP